MAKAAVRRILGQNTIWPDARYHRRMNAFWASHNVDAFMLPLLSQRENYG
ncbi:hypothetical protein [Shinella sp.]|nr:hypothetical protein [Shinella sp.]